MPERLTEPSTQDKRLEALLEVSQQIARELRLDELVQTLVRVAGELFDTTGATITAIDDAGMATVLGSNSAMLTRAGIPTGFRYPMSDFGILWDELRAGRGIIIDDVGGDTEHARAYRAGILPEAPDQFIGHRSWMAVPLAVQARVTGWMVVTHTEPGRYDADDLRIASAMASQAAVAFENARLYEESQQRTGELSTLLAVSHNVASTLELEPLLDLVLEQTASILPYHRLAIMLLENDDALHIRAVRAASGRPDETLGSQVGMKIPVSETPSVWARLRTGVPQIINDVHGDAPIAADYRREVGPFIGPALAEFQSWMGLPLVLQGEFIGVLTVAASEPSRYSVRHSEIGSAIAAQVAVAVANARLFEQTKRQARELTTLLGVSHNVAANIELTPLLNFVLRELGGVLPHDRMSIQTYDDGCLTVLAARDISPAGARARSRDGYRTEVADDFFATGFPDRMPAIIDDILGEGDLAREFRAAAHPHITSGLVPHGSYMGIPLVSRDHVIGLLSVMRDQPGFYTSDHARVAHAIASQIAIALENARLYETAQQQGRETEALLRADTELFRTLNLDHVLQALVDVAVDVLGADKSIVVLHEGEIDVVRAARNHAPANLAIFNDRLATMPHEEPPPAGQLPQVYANATDAPEFARDALAREGIKSHISLPIRDPERMLGIFGVSFVTRHVFTEEEQRLYIALADRAAVAIKNAELYARAQQAASLEERQRLARELHDSVSQALYGIALGTRTARMRLGDDPHPATEPIDYVMALAQTGLAEMRALIFELRPESLQEEGIVAAIEKQIASTMARYDLAIAASLCNEPDCGIEVKEALYRIAQEALHNVVKHAQAQRIDVRLERDSDALVLTISDDGRGFDTVAAFPGHVGLHSMPERAAKLGGSVTIESSAESGTRVVARVPL